MRALINILPAIICIVVFDKAQRFTNQKDPIIGTWKGTSICQQKNSACHDEVVVCHISKAPAPNTYKFVMNKIVNGAEEPMGELEFIYNEAQNSLTCHSVSRYESDWKFNVKPNALDGTLTVDKKTLFRIIKLARN